MPRKGRSKHGMAKIHSRKRGKGGGRTTLVSPYHHVLGDIHRGRGRGKSR